MVSRILVFARPFGLLRVQDYLAAVDGIIFIVDAADRTRFAEAGVEGLRLRSASPVAKSPKYPTMGYVRVNVRVSMF